VDLFVDRIIANHFQTRARLPISVTDVRIAADGDRKLMTSKGLLPGLAGAAAAESFLHALSPENARALPLSGHVLLFG
jgi:hypothetical protein